MSSLDLLSPTAARPSFLYSSDRLERATRATHRRNAERPAVDLSGFDHRQVRQPAIREALRAFLGNLYFLEAAGAANLSRLALGTPNAALRAAYGAQMGDELAHAQILRRYLTSCLEFTDLREHPVSIATRRLGMLVQHHPLIGVESITLPIEFYATHLIDALVHAVDEPALRASLVQIRQDEGRHMVVATEAVRILERSGMGAGAFMRARRRAMRAAAEWFTKHVMNEYLRRHAGVLGIPWDALYDRSMDEIAASLAKEADSDGTGGEV
jgi:hypothetical protein